MCHRIGHSCLVCLWHVDHDQISSERAAHSLVMEFVPPIKITNMAEVTQANIINPFLPRGGLLWPFGSDRPFMLCSPKNLGLFDWLAFIVIGHICRRFAYRCCRPPTFRSDISNFPTKVTTLFRTFLAASVQISAPKPAKTEATSDL